MVVVGGGGIFYGGKAWTLTQYLRVSLRPRVLASASDTRFRFRFSRMLALIEKQCMIDSNVVNAVALDDELDTNTMQIQCSNTNTYLCLQCFVVLGCECPGLGLGQGLIGHESII